jgi:uncharacterized protein DUF6883
VALGEKSLKVCARRKRLILDDGRHKSRLFQALLGLTRDQATLLLDALKTAAVDGEAVAGRFDRYGQRYVIDFEFVGPIGRAMLRSAWIIRPGETAPRLDMLHSLRNRGGKKLCYLGDLNY